MTIFIEIGPDYPTDNTYILKNDYFTEAKEYLIESDAWKILQTLDGIVKRASYYQEILEIVWENFDHDTTIGY